MEFNREQGLKILICGLPGAGKTTLAKELAYHFQIPHHNADVARERTQNYDFGAVGRSRQALYMYSQWGILDFIAPTEYHRLLCQPDFIIWMNTITEGRFEDTNKLFEKPENPDIEVTKWIGKTKLRKCLGDFSPGIEGIQNFLKEGLPKLVKS